MPGVRSSVASAMSLVIRSSTTVPTAAAMKTRRSGPAIRGLAAFAIFLFLLAGDAEPGVGQGVQAFEVDLLAALLAVTELLGIAIEPPQSLVHMPEIPALLRRKKELLLPLHCVGSLIRHMEGVGREIGVGRLDSGIEGLVVISQLLHDAGALLHEALLEMAQLFLIHHSSMVEGRLKSDRPDIVVLPPPPHFHRAPRAAPGPALVPVPPLPGRGPGFPR